MCFVNEIRYIYHRRRRLIVLPHYHTSERDSCHRTLRWMLASMRQIRRARRQDKRDTPNTGLWMVPRLYLEIAICSEIPTQHINALCGQNVEIVILYLAVHIVTTGL